MIVGAVGLKSKQDQKYNLFEIIFKLIIPQEWHQPISQVFFEPFKSDLVRRT